MAQLVVGIEDGQIQGRTRINYDGEIFYSFQGIPYAKPPLGELRFKAPQPVEPWTGILDATKDASPCYAHDTLSGTTVGSEDCLFVNVFTKSTASPELKPVMVWIHGGAFVHGSSRSELYGPEFLLMQDIVLVSFNYRLGILGFLALEDSSLEIPGNAALKDVALALRWVKKNVRNFCGDPENITIFGESAGAAIVHYVVLSPVTKGLFHKAIIQSGCALNLWSRGRRVTKEIAAALEMDTTDEKKILERLLQLPVADLLALQDKLTGVTVTGIFAPVIEKPTDEQPFIWEEPSAILREGKYNKVPTIFGYNTHEGMLSDALAVITGTKPTETVNFELAVPIEFGLKFGSPEIKEVAEKIKKFYYGEDEPNENNRDIYYELLTDTLFFIAIHRTLIAQVSTTTEPHYFYRFSLDASLNFIKRIGKIQTKGACHADELGYLFKSLWTPEVPPGSVEDVAIRRMVKMWTNFATFGRPIVTRDALFGVDWETVGKDAVNFVDIGEELIAGVDPDGERVAFWNELYRVYGRK